MSTQNVKTSSIETVDPNRIALPKPGQDRKVYTRFIREMDQLGHNCDLNLGRIYWLQGKALEMVRPTIKGNAKWRAFCKSIEMSVTTSKYRRRFAKLVTEKDSFTTRWTDWLKICYPSYRKKHEDLIEENLAKDYPHDEGVTTGKDGNGDDDDPPTPDYALTELVGTIAEIKATIGNWVNNDINANVDFANLTKVVLGIEKDITICRDDMYRIVDKLIVLVPEEHQGKFSRKIAA